MLTKRASVSFDANAKCDLFHHFLRQTFGEDPEMIAYVQRCLGYAITGDTSEQMMFLLLGTGANGKGVLLEAIRGILGTYAATVPPSVLIARKWETHIPNDVASLVGVRLGVASETERNQVFAVAQLKRLTGEDTVAARHLHREFFSFQPILKLFLATNETPAFDGSDLAFARRLQLWRFENVVSEHNRDKNLKTKLRQEAPGILNWLIEGCLLWRDQGLNPPPRVRDAVEAYRHSMDRTGRFLEDCCTTDPNLRVRTTELYQRYHGWCSLQAEGTAVSPMLLEKDLQRKNIYKIKSNGNMYYRGVAIKSGLSG